MPAVEGAGFSPHLPRCTPSRHLLWPPCVEGVFVHGKRINRASARRRRPGCSEAESVGREPQRMVRRRSLCQKCRGWHRFSEGTATFWVKLIICVSNTYRKSGTPKGYLIFRKLLCIKHLRFCNIPCKISGLIRIPVCRGCSGRGTRWRCCCSRQRWLWKPQRC